MLDERAGHPALLHERSLSCGERRKCSPGLFGWLRSVDSPGEVEALDMELLCSSQDIEL